MDRRTLLERLDAVRPDSDDLDLPEFSQVREAIRDDAGVAAIWDRRQQFDRRVAEVMQDIDVPGDLRSRLLQAVESSEKTDDVVLPSEERVGGRRQFLVWGGALAASVVGGGIYWSQSGNTPQPLTMANVEDASGEFLAGTQPDVPFQGDFTPRLPRGRWNRLRFRPAVYGLMPSASGYEAAGWRFVFDSDHNSQGVLVTIPQTSVAAPPDHDRDYVGGSTVAWTERGFVYVCRVDGQIDRLLRQISGGRLA